MSLKRNGIEIIKHYTYTMYITQKKSLQNNKYNWANILF